MEWWKRQRTQGSDALCITRIRNPLAEPSWRRDKSAIEELRKDCDEG
jgi:hypothetical protein